MQKTIYKVLKPISYEGKKYEPGRLIPLGGDVDTNELLELGVIESASQGEFVACDKQDANATIDDHCRTIERPGAKCPQAEGSASQGEDKNYDTVNTPKTSARTNGTIVNPDGEDGVILNQHSNDIESDSSNLNEQSQPESQTPSNDTEYSFLTANKQLEYIQNIADTAILEELLEESKASVQKVIKKRIKDTKTATPEGLENKS